MPTEDTMIDEDTRLGDLLPAEFISAFQGKSSALKPYIETLEDKISHLEGMIEAFEVMGDEENAEIYKLKLKEISHAV
jgi:hypothetical protein